MTLFASGRRSLPALAALAACLPCAASGQISGECGETATAQIRVDAGHPWRPPFGLDRVGRPVEVVVELSTQAPPIREYTLVSYRDGAEIERHSVRVRGRQAPYLGTAAFQHHPQELALLAQCRFAGSAAEIARTKLTLPAFEADAAAAPEQPVNPTDLNAIFPPHNWLLLPAGAPAVVEIAAVSHEASLQATLKAWFDTSEKPVARTLTLERGVRHVLKLGVPPPRSRAAREALHITLTEPGGRQLWSKEIPTMMASPPGGWPAFGAVETKLRYDLPISVRNPATGAFSTLDYQKGWDDRLHDVVVRLPNGSRYVFWRGSSYIPFWVSAHGTGLSYEWAETTPPPDGFVDSVEPLMDKELRYGRVSIVASTPSRIHVRWDYQSTDFNYKVWGDAASEDYYFYPDSLGTRVLTLKAKPAADYELSEFIVLTPPSAYPLDVLPRKMVEMLYIDGEKQEVLFPAPGAAPQSSNLGRKLENPRKVPILFRVRMHKDDPASAIYFNPNDRGVPLVFNSFFDRGYLVTPAYWGSHWPLARGNSTGSVIDDRIAVTPAHNSMMTWGMGNRPTPISTSEITTLDSMGAARPMVIQRWAWLIGMTDATDAEALEWARSFGAPASIEVTGARLDLNAYVPERRAYRVQAEGNLIRITVKPVATCINPVFEIGGAPRQVKSIRVAGTLLPPGDYAWDGRTLWVRARIHQPQQIVIEFAS